MVKVIRTKLYKSASRLKRHEGREVNLKAWVNIGTPRTSQRHLHKRVDGSALRKEEKHLLKAVAHNGTVIK